MTLRTGCILRARSQSMSGGGSFSDHLFVSIMSLHTLNDGKTLDHRLTHDLYDEHWTVLAPPLKLLGDYYKRGLPWDDFVERFNDYLHSPLAHEALLRLIFLARRQEVTIMCIEDSTHQCHRRLIAARCQELAPDLEIIIE